MKNTPLVLIFVFLASICSYGSFAQHKLSIVLKDIPAKHSNERVFVAGSFNGWNPSATALTYSIAEKSWSVQLADLKPDVYEFKFTRGSWDAVQSTSSGADVQNNLVKLTSDTSLAYTVTAWKDDFVAVPRKHTASANVHILDTAFAMPQLADTRRIWIYLPEGYEKNTKRFPVLYLQDGQNLFDEFYAPNGEWGIDECLDSMIAKGKPACIVVGIDNGPKRMNEYNPYNNDRFGKGDGDSYVKFIAETLKPFIDSKFRTLSSDKNTIIAGSSMGGLISYYAAIAYPSVFGKAGIFSPAFWTAAPSIYNFTDSVTKKINGRYFFYAGGSEGEGMIPDMMHVMDTLGVRSAATIYSFTDAESRHNEQAWRHWFPDFYLWIMAEGNNTVVNLQE